MTLESPSGHRPPLSHQVTTDCTRSAPISYRAATDCTLSAPELPSEHRLPLSDPELPSDHRLPLKPTSYRPTDQLQTNWPSTDHLASYRPADKPLIADQSAVDHLLTV